jgi:hypothetical protein
MARGAGPGGRGPHARWPCPRPPTAARDHRGPSRPAPRPQPSPRDRVGVGHTCEAQLPQLRAGLTCPASAYPRRGVGGRCHTSTTPVPYRPRGRPAPATRSASAAAACRARTCSPAASGSPAPARQGRDAEEGGVSSAPIMSTDRASPHPASPPPLRIAHSAGRAEVRRHGGRGDRRCCVGWGGAEGGRAGSKSSQGGWGRGGRASGHLAGLGQPAAPAIDLPCGGGGVT